MSFNLILDVNIQSSAKLQHSVENEVYVGDATDLCLKSLTPWRNKSNAKFMAYIMRAGEIPMHYLSDNYNNISVRGS